MPCLWTVLHVAYRDLKKWEDGEDKLLTISEMQQISGRAGRKGMDITGEAVILAGIRNEQRRKDAEYLIKVRLSEFHVWTPCLSSHLQA